MDTDAKSARMAMQQEITRAAANESHVAPAVLRGRQSGHQAAIITAETYVFHDVTSSSALFFQQVHGH